MNHLTYRFRRVPRPAVALLAGALLLCAAPAGAGWLDRGIGVAGVGHAVKETLDENTGIFGKMVSAVIDDDDETVSELMGEIKKTPGKLIQRAFPVLEAPQAVAEKLKSAKRKIERFVGGVGETLADARAALALDGDAQDGAWSDSTLLGGEPLPIPADTTFTAPKDKSPGGVYTASTGAGSPALAGADGNAPAWDLEEWAVARQEAKPHCYGVVDLETLPAECFGQADAESPATSKVEDSPRLEATGWAAGEWAVEDDGWAGGDKSDPRYGEADRDAARVGVFAAECWGVYEVSTRHGLYELMRERMQRNECPREDTSRAAARDTTPGDGGYLSALSDLEAEQLRLEEEERERQARLEREEQERQARRKAEARERRARREEEERRQQEYDLAEQRQQAEYRRQTLQNVTESLRGFTEQVNRTYGTGVQDDRSCVPRPIEICNVNLPDYKSGCRQSWSTCGQR